MNCILCFQLNTTRKTWDISGLNASNKISQNKPWFLVNAPKFDFKNSVALLEQGNWFISVFSLGQ